MDAEFKQEQIGTLFAWVGSLEVGREFWGGGRVRGVQPKNRTCLSSKRNSCLLFVAYTKGHKMYLLVGLFDRAFLDPSSLNLYFLKLKKNPLPRQQPQQT